MAPMTSVHGLPSGHPLRLARAYLALQGLSVGDAFGERFFCARRTLTERLTRRELPPAPWSYTDDTAMALGVFAVLAQRGDIDQDQLAAVFASNYAREPWRGYGGMAHYILDQLGVGRPWRQVAGAAFGGEGSMGNGGAMRVAPVGAYFADDLRQAAHHACLSAQVTHAHPEGQAGAIAVAVAAAWAWSTRERRYPIAGLELLETAASYTPEGDTRRGLNRACELPFSTVIETAVNVLGNGSHVTAPDTVPFALWAAARHLDNFQEALWVTVSGLGDRDTTCAIVGGIVALVGGGESIPEAWLQAREPLPIETVQ